MYICQVLLRHHNHVTFWRSVDCRMAKLQIAHHPIRAPRGTTVHAASPVVSGETACGRPSPRWVTATVELDCSKCRLALCRIRIVGDDE